MRLYLAQINPTVGDLHYNRDLILQEAKAAKAAGADLFVTPELALTGYPPRDLLDRPGFIRDVCHVLDELRTALPLPSLVGTLVRDDTVKDTTPPRIHNAAVFIASEQIKATHKKILLPTYDVFDEARYFMPGQEPTVISVNTTKIGVTICEDIWNDKDYWRHPRYHRDPIEDTVAQGVDLIVNLSASPYERNKPATRTKVLQSQALKHGVPIAYCNQVGGNDSLLFDGGSLCINTAGEIVGQSKSFEEAHLFIEFDGSKNCKLISEPHPVPPTDWRAEFTDALTMGIRDYTKKCGFDSVVIGLSGGIDSALTAALAVRALGPNNVRGITMPSRYSSEGAANDAIDLGRRLGIQVDTIAIEPMFQAYLSALGPAFEGTEFGVAEENLQARIRGDLLMAYSNKFGSLLLTTGNKSELAVGYCTLYGDMCGGLAVISDVYKTDVYALSDYLNEITATAPIPPSTITKPPSAELRPDQIDEDSLPPYPVLDSILRQYIDQQENSPKITPTNPQLVQDILRLVDRNEYKRRQAPPGLRVSHKAFGEGRRLPIAQRYSPGPNPDS